MRNTRGEAHPLARLTQGQVNRIKQLWVAGYHYQHQIAAHFEVTGHYVSSIVNGRTWAYTKTMYNESSEWSKVSVVHGEVVTWLSGCRCEKCDVFS